MFTNTVLIFFQNFFESLIKKIVWIQIFLTNPDQRIRNSELLIRFKNAN
jgi:hypothetical protein